MGLDCVYIINSEDNSEACMFGSRGKSPGQFRDPTGIEIDNAGNMVVVDSRNHRLQVINSKLEFSGLVSSNHDFSRPLSIHFDFESRDFCVTNKGSRTVSQYEF